MMMLHTTTISPIDSSSLFFTVHENVHEFLEAGRKMHHLFSLVLNVKDLSKVGLMFY